MALEGLPHRVLTNLLDSQANWEWLYQRGVGSGSSIYFNVVDYGAVGDGSTDDSAAFQSAVDAAAGGVVWVPSGTYALADGITGPMNVLGAGVDETVLLQDYNGPLFEVTGTIGSPVDVDVQVDPGDNTLTLASTSGLAAGDYLRLQGDEVWPTPDDPSAIIVGEIVRVKSVDSGTVVTLKGRVDEEYLLANSPVVYPIDMEGPISMANLTMRNDAPGTHTTGAVGCSFDWVRDVLITNVKVEAFDFAGFTFDECVDWLVSDCQFLDGDPDEGYGVEVKAGCRDGQVRNCRARNCRHLFTNGGADGEILCRHIHISDCIAAEMSSSGFDTHDTGRYIVFSNCTTASCEATGFNVRAADTILADCIAINTWRGVRVNEGGARTLINGGFFEESHRGASGGTSSAGIIVEANDVTIRGVRIRRCDDRAIELRTQGNNLRVEATEIDSPGLVGTATGIIFRVGSGHTVDGLIVANASSAVRVESGVTFGPWGRVGIRSTTNFFSLAATAVAPTWQGGGTGTPEATHHGAVGSIYQRTDGGAATSFYVKEANPTTNAGWVAK